MCTLKFFGLLEITLFTHAIQVLRKFIELQNIIKLFITKTKISILYEK